MGYRLHVSIPNIKPYDKYLELGKQDNSTWDEFNWKWFGGDNDGGLIGYEEIEEFYEEYVELNNQLLSDYKLYNTEHLKKMVDYALLHELDMFFVSY